MRLPPPGTTPKVLFFIMAIFSAVWLVWLMRQRMAWETAVPPIMVLVIAIFNFMQIEVLELRQRVQRLEEQQRTRSL